jgi:membrane associated rhomboid family serine protease
MSCMFTSNRSIGASTADFGIFTGILAMIFVNWKAFDGSQQLEQTRCMLIFFVVIMIVLNFTMTAGAQSSSSTDTYGHLGGALLGLIWGMAVFPRIKSPGGEKMRIAGLVMTGLFFSLCLLLFFLVVKPYPVYPY